VKKKECCGQGEKANDKRAYIKQALNKALQLFWTEDDWDHHFKYPLMMLWACHLMTLAILMWRPCMAAPNKPNSLWRRQLEDMPPTLAVGIP
jgi:hypothetical protein